MKGYENATPATFGTFKEGSDEFMMSERFNKFIENHLEKYLKSLVPMHGEEKRDSSDKQLKAFYDPLYNGIIRFLGTDGFNDFFEGRFDASRINDNGEYKGGFDDFKTCHYVLNLKEILKAVDSKPA